MKKVTYSECFKEQARVKVFSRGNRTVQAVADELNISLQTLKNWMKSRCPKRITRSPENRNDPRTGRRKNA